MTTNPDRQSFERLVAALDYPMFVVTTRTRSEQSAGGCLVGFATQTSVEPPRFLVGLSRQNRTFRLAREATHLAVHLLPREQVELAKLFGAETGDRIDKFSRCTWHDGPEDMPILDHAAAWFVGAICDRFDLGDHVGHLLMPTAAMAPDEFTGWLSYADVRDLEPGHDA